jgi:hypothetical protein
MQHTHRLVYLANHMFVDLPEGRFLVDTGSPASFGETRTASYGGVERPIPRSLVQRNLVQRNLVQRNLVPLSVKSLAGLDLEARIGARLRGVLGMDLLATDTVLWDGPRGRAIVRPSAPPADAVRVELTVAGGVPLVEACVGGGAGGGGGGGSARCGRWIFRTGAQCSYFREGSDLTLGDPDGEFEDVVPGLSSEQGADGHAFRTPAAKVAVVLGANGAGDGGAVPASSAVVRFRDRFGHHAPLSAQVLEPAGVAGVIGVSWLAKRRVWFAPTQGAMWVAAG